MSLSRRGSPSCRENVMESTAVDFNNLNIQKEDLSKMALASTSVAQQAVPRTTNKANTSFAHKDAFVTAPNVKKELEPGTHLDFEHSPSSGSQRSSGDDVSPTRRALADGFLRRKLEILAQSNNSKGVEARAQLRKLKSGEQTKIDFINDDDPFGPGLHPSALLSPESMSSRSTPTKASQKAQSGAQSSVVTPTRSVQRSGGTRSASKKVTNDGWKAEISADNAQAMLPPSSCVFVANLAQTRTDDELEASVKSVFEKFGTVYVKIRRDTKGMPFAFCQYENDADAQRAITQGRRSLIDGRPCRTEPARVNRSLYMSRHIGGMISEVEARGILQSFGQIESMWHSSPTDMELYQLPEGIWVKFAYYQDCRDAQSNFRDNSIYRLEQPAVLPDFSMQSGRGRMAFMNRRSAVNADSSLDQRALRPYSPRHSIYVGNLPPDTTNKELQDKFHHYGPVSEITVMHRMTIPNDSPPTVFAFVDFVSEQAAFSAVENENSLILNGYPLRVELKDTAEHLNRRSYTNPFSYPLTPYKTPGRNRDARARPNDLSGRKSLMGSAQARFQGEPYYGPITPQHFYPNSGAYSDLAAFSPENGFGASQLSLLNASATNAPYKYRQQWTTSSRGQNANHQDNGASTGSVTGFTTQQVYNEFYGPPVMDFGNSMMQANIPQSNASQHVYWMPPQVLPPGQDESSFKGKAPQNSKVE